MFPNARACLAFRWCSSAAVAAALSLGFAQGQTLTGTPQVTSVTVTQQAPGVIYEDIFTYGWTLNARVEGMNPVGSAGGALWLSVEPGPSPFARFGAKTSCNLATPPDLALEKTWDLPLDDPGAATGHQLPEIKPPGPNEEAKRDVPFSFNFTFGIVCDDIHVEPLETFEVRAWFEPLPGKTGPSSTPLASNYTIRDNDVEPQAPTAVEARGSASSVTVTWSEPANVVAARVKKYVVDLDRTSGSNPFSYNATAGEATTLDWPGPFDDQVGHEVRVCASPSDSSNINVLLEHCGPWSAVKQVDFTCDGCPARPTGFTATTGSADGQILTAWTGVPGTTYELEYWAVGSPQSRSVTATNLTGTAYTVPGLSPGQEYRLRLRAVLGAGQSAKRSLWSAEVTAAAGGSLPQIPTPPLDVRLASRDGRLYLAWDEPANHLSVGAAITYEIQARTETGSWRSAAPDTTSTAADWAETTPGLHQGRVLAKTGPSRKSLWAPSDWVPIRGNAVPEAPANPLLAATATALTFGWDPPPNLTATGQVTYEAEYRRAGTVAWNSFPTVTGRVATLASPTSGASYTARVRARSGGGYGPHAEAGPVTVPAGGAADAPDVTGIGIGDVALVIGPVPNIELREADAPQLLRATFGYRLPAGHLGGWTLHLLVLDQEPTASASGGTCAALPGDGLRDLVVEDAGWLGSNGSATAVRTNPNPAGGDDEVSFDFGTLCADSVPEGDEFLRVEAWFTKGADSGSRASRIIRIVDDDDPTSPSGLTLTPGRTTIHASWTAPQADPAPVDYSVIWAEGGQGSYTQPLNTGDTSFAISGLKPDTYYRVRVGANYTGGGTAWAFADTTTLAGADNLPPVEARPLPPIELGIGQHADVSLAGAFTDPEGDEISYLPAPSSSRAQVATVSDVSGGAAGAFRVTAHAEGTAMITVSATDGRSGTGRPAVQTFTVTVTADAVNQAPTVARQLPDLELGVRQLAVVNLAGTFTDPEGNPISYRPAPTSSRTAVATVTNVTPGAFTVNAVAVGTSTITVSATDDQSGPNRPAVQTFDVTVTAAAVNQPPTVVRQLPDLQIGIGQTATVSLVGAFTDPEGDDMTYSALSTVPDIASAAASGTVVTVVGKSEGATTVTVAAKDTGSGRETPQIFNVTVLPGPVNEPPGLGTPLPPITVQVGSTALVNVAGAFTDPEGDELSYRATSDRPDIAGVRPAQGTVVPVVGVKVGNATLTILATDDTSNWGRAAPQTVPVEVVPAAFNLYPPVDVRVTSTRIDELDVDWTPPREGDRPGRYQVGYQFLLLLDPGGQDGQRARDQWTIAGTPSAPPITIQGLEGGTAYSVQVCSQSAAGEPDPPLACAWGQGTPRPANAAPEPATVLEDVVLPFGETQYVPLGGAFVDPEGDAMTYRAVSGRPDVVLVSPVPRGSTMLELRAVGVGASTIVVSADDGFDGPGRPVDQRFIVTVEEGPPPGAPDTWPTGLRIVEDGGATIELEWRALAPPPESPSAATVYRLRWSPPNGYPYEEAGISSPRFRIPKVVAGVQYRFSVAAAWSHPEKADEDLAYGPDSPTIDRYTDIEAAYPEITHLHLPMAGDYAELGELRVEMRGELMATGRVRVTSRVVEGNGDPRYAQPVEFTAFRGGFIDGDTLVFRPESTEVRLNAKAGPGVTFGTIVEVELYDPEPAGVVTVTSVSSKARVSVGGKPVPALPLWAAALLAMVLLGVGRARAVTGPPRRPDRSACGRG